MDYLDYFKELSLTEAVFVYHKTGEAISDFDNFAWIYERIDKPGLYVFSTENTLYAIRLVTQFKLRANNLTIPVFLSNDRECSHIVDEENLVYGDFAELCLSLLTWGKLSKNATNEAICHRDHRSERLAEKYGFNLKEVENGIV